MQLEDRGNNVLKHFQAQAHQQSVTNNVEVLETGQMRAERETERRETILLQLGQKQLHGHIEEHSQCLLSQQLCQQISELTLDCERSLGSKAVGPKPSFRDNHSALSYAAASYLEGRLAQLEKRIEEIAKAVLKCHTQQLQMHLQVSLASAHNGSFLWRIPEVARRKRDAIEERITSIYTPPFYTGR